MGSPVVSDVGLPAGPALAQMCCVEHVLSRRAAELAGDSTAGLSAGRKARDWRFRYEAWDGAGTGACVYRRITGHERPEETRQGYRAGGGTSSDASDRRSHAPDRWFGMILNLDGS